MFAKCSHDIFGIVVSMRSAAHLLVAVLAWSLAPGVNELAENLWHLAVSGHSAHAIGQGEDHAPEGDEHGCSGTLHLCGCYHSTQAVVAQRRDIHLHAVDARLLGLVPASPLEPFVAGLLRPPQG